MRQSELQREWSLVTGAYIGCVPPPRLVPVIVLAVVFGVFAGYCAWTICRRTNNQPSLPGPGPILLTSPQVWRVRKRRQ